MHPVSRVLLVVVGAALVIAGVVWVLLTARNLHEFEQAGGALGAAIFAGLPGATAGGAGLFLVRLAAARYPGSI
jgi:hypothetical protein